MNLVLWKKLNFNNLQNSSNSAYSAIAELKLVEILVNYNNAIVMRALKYLKGSKKRTIEEAVDVIYHLIVLLKSKKITLNEINKELEKRKTNVR